MKKTILLFMILVSFIFGFSHAQESGNLFYQQKKIEKPIRREVRLEPLSDQKPKSVIQLKSSSGTTQQFSGGLLPTKKGSPLLSGGKKTNPSLVCITGDKLIVRESLSKKALEASQKLLSLAEVSSKVGYDTKKIISLAKNLQSLSSQIAKDCSPIDFQQHRQQIKEALDALKIEIQRFKQYVARLHTR